MSKPRLDHDPVICAVEGCLEAASIIHCEVSYCGKHALEAWKREEDQFYANKRSPKRLPP